MRLPFSLGLLLTLAITTFGAPEFKSIFDGRTLDGWEPHGHGKFRVDNETILCETGNGTYGWLFTKKTYGDFILDLEVKHDATGNSGVQVRSHLDEKETMIGYQFDIDPGRPSTGRLYDEARRKLLQDVPMNPQARGAFKVGEWNTMRLQCIGDHLQSWLNGVPISDYIDSVDLSGILALQVHTGNDVHVRFRNLRIQDLGRRSWKPLWDGKTLKGWHQIGKGDWQIKNGSIVANHSKSEKDFGHLVSDASFKDFTICLKYKASTGNSGLYFRIEEKGASGVTGFQAEIDPEKDTGGLYETNGRAWVSQPKPEDVKKWYRPNEWNSMTVSAHGRRIAVNVNDLRTAELLDDPGRSEGRIALQLHGGQDVQIEFKDIEILSGPE